MHARLLALIALPALAHAGDVVTYRDVQPVLVRHCQGCHQPGEIGPMALTTYKETRPWARAIREAVVKRTMPPWHADAETSRHFANDRSLPEADRQTIVSWVEQGAKEGEPLAATTTSARADSGWTLGKPDLIVRIPGYRVPASGTLEYTFLVSPTNLPEDRWIAAAEWRVDQRSVVHHINAFIRPPGSSYVKAAKPGELYVASREERAARRSNEREVERRELLLGYEPGYLMAPWGPERGKLLPKGADIVFEMHYTANGKPVVDYSELGITFARRPPRERVVTLTPADSTLVIPPGATSHPSHTGATLTADVTLVSLQPHMHLRGKAYEVAARFPDGRREVLLRVPRYDFRWQTTYALREPLRLPQGTVLEYAALFDNSPNNPANPDPQAEVRWGDQSWEEMNVGFTEVAFDVTRDPEVARLHGTTRPAPTSQRR